jgi:hypothetical protein
VLSASAQQATPLPHVQMAIPVAPPPGWGAAQWASLRAHCQSLADRAAARMPYATWQEMEDAKMCMELAPYRRPPPASHRNHNQRSEVVQGQQRRSGYDQEVVERLRCRA